MAQKTKKARMAKGHRGGPMLPGESPKPAAMDKPSHGTFPMVTDHPTRKRGRGMGGGGDCPGY